MKLKWLRGAKYAKLNPVATPIISQRRLVEVAIKKKTTCSPGYNPTFAWGLKHTLKTYTVYCTYACSISIASWSLLIFAVTVNNTLCKREYFFIYIVETELTWNHEDNDFLPIVSLTYTEFKVADSIRALVIGYTFSKHDHYVIVSVLVIILVKNVKYRTSTYILRYIKSFRNMYFC
jgi:hypothetical protein